MRGRMLSVADSMALRRKSIAYDQALDLADASTPVSCETTWSPARTIPN